MGTSSIFLRAALAVALMAGFYLLALSIVAALIWFVYLDVEYGRIAPKLILFCLAGAGAILWSILPRRDRFEAPGKLLTPEGDPEIHRLIDEVAATTGQASPREVYLIPQINAWVAQRGGVMGFGSRRVMGLGLPLMQSLKRSELRAVLAHEFGHFARGDTMLGPWIYKTRSTIGRTIRGLTSVDSVLSLPFVWYGNLFLRISHAVSRHQELFADRLACGAFGSKPLIDGLKRIHAASAAWDLYWRSEIAPLLGASLRPPLTAGFARFLNNAAVTEMMLRTVNMEMAEGGTRPYDTHPPLRERVAAAESLPAGEIPAKDPLAITLLRDPEGMDLLMLSQATGLSETWASSLKPVAWNEVGERLYLKAWRDLTWKNARRLSGILVSDLPRLAGDLESFASTLEGTRDQAVRTLGAALGVALAAHGWILETGPGEPVRLLHGAQALDPMAAVSLLVTDRTSHEPWSAFCESAGIGSIDLGGTPG